MIQVTCKNCREVLSIPKRYAGQSGNCAMCGARLQVPQKGEVVTQDSVLSEPHDLSEGLIFPKAAVDWQNEPASDIQMSRLSELGATFSQMMNLTKEQAAYLIEELQSRPPSTSAFVHDSQGVQSPQTHYPHPPKSRVAYILLALVLGFLGIHNFYAGRGVVGAIQLGLMLSASWLVLPVLIVPFWVIVDICTIDRDGAGVPFT